MNPNNDRTYKNRPQMDYFNSPNGPRNQLTTNSKAVFPTNRNNQEKLEQPLKIKISKKKISYSTQT